MPSIPNRTVGLDISDTLTHVYAIGREGEVELETEVPTEKSTMAAWLEWQPLSRVVL